MDGDNPVSYYMEDIDNFLYDKDKEINFKWAQMIPDPAVKKIKEFHKAGLISFRLSIA